MATPAFTLGSAGFASNAAAGEPGAARQAIPELRMEFEKIVDIAYWKAIEQKSMPLGERVRQTINKLVKKIA